MIVRFEDVITRITGNVDRYNTDLEYYVGGDQYDSSSLTIERRGDLKKDVDILGFKFHFPFKSGDVLLMARNPHLRKAGQVFFDGLCSDASYILRTKDEKRLRQNYIPIILQSNHFWDWFESHKTGGITFLLNWGMLKGYEFDLPNSDVQDTIMEKVWAAYKLKQSYQKLIIATDEMVKSRFIEMFGNPVTNTKSWPTKSLSEVAPESPSTNKATGQVWVLNLDMVESQSGRVIEKVYDNVESLNSVAPFDDGNVLFSKLRPYLNKVVIPNGQGYATTELVPLRPDTNIVRKEFLACLLRSNDFVNYADAIATGTKMPRMPMTALRAFKCINPPLDLQDEFIKVSQQSDKSKFELKQAIEKIDKVMRALLQ